MTEEGLDVELIKMSAPLANLALIGGNVAFGAAGAAAIPSVVRGAPLRFLFHTYFRPIYWLYAQPDIRDLRALKNKKVGVSGIGSGPDLLLREILRKQGLEGGRDVAIMAARGGNRAFFRAESRLGGRSHALSTIEFHGRGSWLSPVGILCERRSG